MEQWQQQNADELLRICKEQAERIKQLEAEIERLKNGNTDAAK